MRTSLKVLLKWFCATRNCVRTLFMMLFESLELCILREAASRVPQGWWNQGSMSLEFGTNCRSFADVPDAEFNHEVRKKAKLVRVIVCATESVIENRNCRQTSVGRHLSIIEWKLNLCNYFAFYNCFCKNIALHSTASNINVKIFNI